MEVDASSQARRARVVVGILGAITLVVVIAGLSASGTPAAPGGPPCNLVPQLRDVTVNQGLGGYSPLVNGKETLARFYLSLPSCAASGASIQIVGGTLTLSGGASGTIAAPTPAPTAPAYPVIAPYSVAPVADSTGDPKFVVPGSMLSKTAAFTANFSTTLSYQARASKSNPYGPVQQVTFSTRPGTSTAISATFDRPSKALAVLFVPMGDGTKTYNTQWTAAGQQALQDGMTAAVSREYPLPAGIGNLGGTGGLRYAVAPTLIDLGRLNLLDSSGKFCGNGANYDAIQAQLAQFRLTYNTANPNAQANRVVGVVDPAVGIDGPAVNLPCFQGMAVVNSQQAWALALPGRTGQLIGIELAHTLGLVPPNRESPFDGAHSQNITAENPSLNRRFNIVQRSFIPIDRSLMKPTATSPAPDNIDTLLEVPDFAFLLCVMGGTVIPECQTYGQPGSVNANAPVGSTIAFVMSGTTDTGSTASLCSTCTGEADGTSVVESYFGSVPLTIPSSTSTYRFVQRNSAGAVISDQGVPVSFEHSEHGTGTTTNNHSSGLFSFALPFQTTTNRVELWNGPPGASGSRLLYAQNSSTAPQVTGFTVGNVVEFLHAQRQPARASAPAISRAVETPSAQSDAPTTPATIAPSSPLGTALSDPTFTVNTNTDPSTPLDTGCTESECTLREAIEAANADPADDTIQFSLTGSTEIDLGSALPAIVGKVAILGSSQPEGQVSVNGAGVSEGASAFVLGAGSDGSEIDDLAIDHFSGGVGIEVVSASNSVSGNDISAVDTGIYVHGGDASANQIGGARSDGIGNRIWGFVFFGIHLDAAGTGNTVQGNTIGLDASDGASGGSTGLSIDATSGTVVGSDVGPSQLADVNYDFGNVVVAGTDADGAGIRITSDATATILAGNFIGTDETQTATDLGNLGVGIDVSGADGNQIGPGNIVAYNGGPGVGVADAVGDRIVANFIHDNGGQGIFLSNGNDDLSSPQLGSASISAGTTTVSGKISGVAAGDYFVEFFENGSCDASGSGEGETYLNFATVTISGSSASFSKTFSGLALDDIVTATLTSTSTNDTSEFSNCVTVQQALPPGQEPFTATASDDHPADARLDGFLDCPGQPVQVIFVGRRPDSVDNTNHTATWSGTIDTSLAPPNCNVEVAVNDGFTRPPITPTGTQTADTGANPVVAAISSPRAGGTILQYGLIPLRGLILNAQGVLGSGAHEWSLTGPNGITRSGTGPIVDLQPPTGGWPPGPYTATLKESGSTDPSTQDSVIFNVVADADNDGIPASVESSSCFGAGGDNDPTNAYGDQDADGIPNVDDPQPCSPASSYTAIIDVNPDPLPTGSSGNPITAYVRVPGRNVSQVLGSSVRITRIADGAVFGDDFKNIGWTVSNGVGTAKFDRQKIAMFLARNNIHNRVISITVAGSSAGSSAWSFSGSDTVFVQG